MSPGREDKTVTTTTQAGSRYLITYTTGIPGLGAATVTRVFTAYSYAAARGTAEEFACKVGNEFGAVLAIAGIHRL